MGAAKTLFSTKVEDLFNAAEERHFFLHIGYAIRSSYARVSQTAGARLLHLRYKVAFQYALGDTLVSDNLDQATRVGLQSRRSRHPRSILLAQSAMEARSVA